MVETSITPFDSSVDEKKPSSIRRFFTYKDKTSTPQNMGYKSPDEKLILQKPEKSKLKRSQAFYKVSNKPENMVSPLHDY